MERTCFNPKTGKAKNIYRSEAEARKHSKKSSWRTKLRIYRCWLCGGFHLTSQKREHEAPPPSASKLRRKLDNITKQLAAEERRELVRKLNDLAPTIARDREYLRREAEAARERAKAAEEEAQVLEALDGMVEAALKGR